MPDILVNIQDRKKWNILITYLPINVLRMKRYNKKFFANN